MYIIRILIIDIRKMHKWYWHL